MPFNLFGLKSKSWEDVEEEILKALNEEKENLGVVEPFEYLDLLTGKRIKLKMSPFYTILSVDGREFYFKKETGEFDGTASTP